ncbi:unnamed protein product [Soboliphyme baturini]|uniref:JmjC domain-containing protein n=1 Tax=Soboliphyme baturini TaxID=241478 RepID=A0A183I9C2_9BILA|nr:unnamed protein product [Soboliphyme baturini]
MLRKTRSATPNVPPRHVSGISGIHLLPYNIDFVRGSWWPNLEDLWQQNIPVFRYTQKPGDIVWVGSGVVHWIQATGWCNSISWNVGPLTSFQYSVALHRYEWNRFISYKSAVPLIHLTWQLAQNIRFADARLFDLLKQTLARSLVYCQLSINFVTGKFNKELKHSSRTLGEVAHYCRICEAEVFNVLFVTENEGKYMVHCLHCALRIDAQLKSFTVLIQYLMDELAVIYNEFVLIPVRAKL